MKLSQIGELPLLQSIRERFKVRSKAIIAGIGDDAAVLEPEQQKLLLTTDMMTEGVHFDPAFITPFQIGFKIVSVNVSDIYAMGGEPRFMLLALAVNKRTTGEFIDSFLNGVQSAMDRYRIKLIGGDLSATPAGMVVSATLAGYAKRPVMRSGARPGDRIYVTGNIGDSACGLELLKNIKRPVAVETGDKTDTPMRWSVMHQLIKRHLLPEARKLGKPSRYATSMIDISDGLFIDLTRLCDESRVGASINVKEIPVSVQMKKAAAFLGMDPLTFATSGGEDYELLFTVPAGKRVNARCIGEITRSDRIFTDADGKKRFFTAEGYRHWH